MAPRESFQRDLAFGNAGEKRVINSFASHGWVVKHRNHDARYDFEMEHPEDGDFLLVEVKTEPSALRWGNIFLEYECRNAPSGIHRSDAHVYVFIVGDKLLAVFKHELLAMMEDYPTKRGGDFDPLTGEKVSLGYIIPVADIEALTAARDEIRRDV